MEQKLLPNQIECFNKIIKVLTTNYAALTTAPPGSGKTRMNFFIAEALKLRMFAVIPSSLEGTYEELSLAHKTDIDVISYDKLAGKGKVKHGLLTQTLNGEYEASLTLINKFKKTPVLLVFDEADMAKNPSSKRIAVCQALSRVIINLNNGSRILLLSATLFDKVENAEFVFRLMGIITEKKLFTYEISNKKYELFGILQAYEYCSRFDREKAINLYPKNLSAKNLKKYLFDLHCNILKVHLGATMPPAFISSKLYPEIRYFTLPDIEFENIKEKVDKLRNTVKYDQNGEIIHNKDSMGKIIHCIMEIEFAMLPHVAKFIYKKLIENQNIKIIIYVWYDKSVEWLMHIFQQFNPLQCDGKIDPITKDKNRVKFQQSNNVYRLLIAKPTSYSRGVSLDDTDGNFERLNVCMPNYSFLEIHQASGRTCRAESKSDSKFIIPFIKGADFVDILNSLFHKSIVTKAASVDETWLDNKTLYIKDYPIVYDTE